MIELFEQNIKTNDRQSSKGNQLKWKKDNVWYKADYTGYEGLSEYVISNLLKLTNLKQNEFVLYEPIEIKYKNQIFRGVKSNNFLNDDWQIITLERLFKNEIGQSLNYLIWSIEDPKERLKFIVDNVQKITGLKDFGKYMNILLTVDALFLNEDRHTHNIAVLMNKKGEYDYCPIFDNGAGLLADTTMDYPLSDNLAELYKMIDSVKAKTFAFSFDEQLEASKILYGQNLKTNFTKKDVDKILGLEENNEVSIYPLEIRKRIRTIIYEQMRKYSYLF